MIKNGLIFLLLFLSINVFSFNLDSLETALKNTKIDSVKVSLYHQISWEIRTSEPKRALEYSLKGIEIAKKTHDKKGEESCLNNIGVIKAMQGKFDESIEYFIKNLEINKELKKREGEATANNNIGLVYYYKGDFTKAVEHYITSLNIYDELDDEDGKASTYNNLGLIYENNKDYDKSLHYQKKALAIRTKQNDIQNLAFSYGNIGNLYFSKEIQDTALIYFLKAEKLFNEVNDIHGIGLLVANIGKIYQSRLEYGLAIEYFEKGIAIQEELDDGYGLAINLLNISEANTLQGKFEPAISFGLKGVEKAEEIQANDVIRQGYSTLRHTYYKAGMFEEAYEYSDKMMILNDSLFSEESKDKIADLETKYGSEQKEKENELLRKDGALKDLELNQSRIINYGVSGALLVFGLLGLLIYRGLAQKKKAYTLLEEKNGQVIKQRDEIRRKNNDILDSLNYAKRIQHAILPPDNYVKSVLPDSFIFYKSKDIVSGDFYWVDTLPCKTVNGAKSEKVVFAAVDCTGHGVPGAFMSIVGYNGLNQMINKEKPALILDGLNELVSNTLHQTQNTKIKEGMDISLCSIDFDNLKLEFAGAYNSVYIIRGEELIERKGGRFSIGSKHYRGDKQYENHTIDLQKGDMIYMTTDGYLDQFGGDDASKYMVFQFRKLILSIANKSTEEQKEIIEQTFESWRGNEDQIDDVCVFGVRV